jgi:tyrosine-protein phosphatase YwqE
MLSPAAIDAERRAGARLQVNGSSLTGRHGAEARAWGIELLRSGRADVIASDAHRPSRPAVLSAALDALAAAGIERAAAEAFVAANPRALLRHGIAADRGARAA